jgi:hypothetical protein
LVAAGEDGWQRYLLPMQAGLGHLMGVEVDKEQETALRQGRLISLPAIEPMALVYATNLNGTVFAILQPAAGGMWQPHKVLDI